MPNYCSNMLTIKGNKKAIGKIKKKYTDEVQLYDNNDIKIRRLSLNLIQKCPKELTEHESPNNDPEKEKLFLKKYRAKDWYQWRLKNWGVKWDTHPVDFEEENESLFFYFDTAWSPPLIGLSKLVHKNPEIKMTLKYAEPAMIFAGEVKWEKGKLKSIEETENPNHKIFKEFGMSFDDESL